MIPSHPENMISKPLKIFLVSLFVVAGTAAIVGLRLDRNRLRQRIGDARRQKAESDRLRDDNRRAQELLKQVETDATGSAQAIHADVMQARAEVAGLEKKAEAARADQLAQTAADATALANNRDPEKGLVRLENFQDVGRAQPGAAFQTFVWAAMKGEDATLAGMIAFPGAAREKAEAVVAALPAEVQAKYSIPEKLAALFFANALTAMNAAQVVDVTLPDAEHAVVTVRGLTDRPQKIPMQLGPSGWQIVVPEGMVGKLGGWALGGSQVPKK